MDIRVLCKKMFCGSKNVLSFENDAVK